MRRQVFGRAREPDLVGMGGCLADKLLEEERAFVPPVPKQFGIERHHENRIEVDLAERYELLPA
jgi:hypothetical protein